MSRSEIATQPDPAGLGTILAMAGIVLLALVFFPLTLAIVAVFFTKDFGPRVLHAVLRKVGVE